MKHTWIIEVLNDLEKYTEVNRLPYLHKEILVAKMIAISELNFHEKPLVGIASKIETVVQVNFPRSDSAPYK